MAIRSERIAVFAGTREGHDLARYLADTGRLERTDFFVATEYGRNALEDVPGVRVISGRMDREAMDKCFRRRGYRQIVDATHPYAAEVTENLRAAAEDCGIAYMRLLREEEDYDRNKIRFVDSPREAAALLDDEDEKFLLTTGARDIGAYAQVKDLRQRGCARVLPAEESLRACLEAGFSRERIICMQGPFTRAMNIATMEQFGCSVLVTKSTGRAGGFPEKAALVEEGYRVIVIGRPEKEEGFTLKEIIERLEIE